MVTNFDLQPTLQGERIIIRPLVADDWQELFAVASDPAIWEQHPEPDRYTEAVFRRFFDAALTSGSAFTFIDRRVGSIIGSSRYHGLDPAAREIEIGWTFLARGYWGGSYNAEIKQLMLEHAFRYVDAVVFRVGENNRRSRRAMEKIGAELRAGPQQRDGGGSNVVYVIRRK